MSYSTEYYSSDSSQEQINLVFLNHKYFSKYSTEQINLIFLPLIDFISCSQFVHYILETFNDS